MDLPLKTRIMTIRDIISIVLLIGLFTPDRLALTHARTMKHTRISPIAQVFAVLFSK